MIRSSLAKAFVIVAGVLAILLLVIIGSVSRERASALQGAWSFAEMQRGSAAWGTVAVSANGEDVAALDVYNRSLSRSGNGGNTWSTVVGPGTAVRDVDISSDGGRLALVTNTSGGGGRLRASTDGGTSWSYAQPDMPRPWSAVALSASGNRLVGLVDNGDVYVSYDGGDNITLTQSTAMPWWSLTRGHNDATWYATTLDTNTSESSIYRSTDTGQTWHELAPPEATGYVWSGLVATQAETLVVNGLSAADPSQGYLYLSRDQGATWERLDGAGQRSWRSVTVSQNGMRIVGAAAGQGVYISLDGGEAWTQLAVPTTLPLYTVAGDKDMSTLYITGYSYNAGSMDGAIYRANYIPPENGVLSDVTWTPSSNIVHEQATYKIAFRAATADIVRGIVLDFCGDQVQVSIGTCVPPEGFVPGTTLVSSSGISGSWNVELLANGSGIRLTQASGAALIPGDFIELEIAGFTNPSVAKPLAMRLVTYGSVNWANRYTADILGDFTDSGLVNFAFTNRDMPTGDSKNDVIGAPETGTGGSSSATWMAGIVLFMIAGLVSLGAAKRARAV